MEYESTDKKFGYRGYVGSRPYDCGDFPQNVQNFWIRSYCQKHHLTYLLSGTEYKMRGCYMILDEILDAIESLEGIVLFSIFMLPESIERRKDIYDRILSAERSLHGALEDIAIRKPEDIQMVEDILTLNKIALSDQHLFNLRDFLIPAN